MAPPIRTMILLAILLVSLSLLSILPRNNGEYVLEAQGMAVKKMPGQVSPVNPNYCSGWQDGIFSCFTSAGGSSLSAFKCQRYYWVPIKGRVVRCCRTYFDCRKAGSFVFSSYCDTKTHTCRFN